MALGLGAIGLGGLGYIELDVISEFDDVDVVAGADISPEARSLFETEFGAPAYDDYGEMLDAHEDDLGAALITTPHTLHFEHAMDCLERDIAVYLEKPMVTDVGDAVELVATAREAGLDLQVGYQRHFHPGFLEVKRLVQDGRIGKLHTINCYLGQDWVEPHRDTWRLNPELSGGGQLYDSGSHLLDVLLWMTESTPVEVSAQIEYLEQDVDVNSSLSLTLSGDDWSAVTSIGVSGYGITLEPWEGYQLWGDEGRVTYSGDRVTVTGRGGATYSTEITSGTDYRTLTREKLRNFVDSVRGEAFPVVPGRYGLWVTALTEAAYMADERGETVDVGALVEKASADRDPEYEPE